MALPGAEPAPGTAPRARVARGTTWGPVIGVVWIIFWLVMLMQSVTAAVARGDDRGWLATGAYVVGAAAYSVACFHGFVRRRHGETVRSAVVAAGVGAVATAVAVAAIGAPGYDLVPYVAVALVAALPLRYSLPFTGTALIGLWVVLLRVDQLEDTSGMFIGAVIATLGTGMGRFSVERGLAAQRYAEEAHELQLQDERNRMARDLHDILGHSLTVIALKADLAGKLVDRDPDGAKRELGELQGLARSALADVRATVHNYREMSLSAELVRARQALTDASIRAELPGTVDDVNPELRELFAWAVREATTNVVRHSGATRCRITLARDRLEVTDDGRGPIGPADGHGEGHVGGHGLAGLRDRAARVGALVETGPADPAGQADRSGPAGRVGPAGSGGPARPGFRLVVREGL